MTSAILPHAIPPSTPHPVSPTLHPPRPSTRQSSSNASEIKSSFLNISSSSTLHLPDLKPPLSKPHTHLQSEVTGSLWVLVSDRLIVSLSHPFRSSANFRSLLSCSPRWPCGHRVLCFSDPLLQNWKIAGNVYLSLSIQEITCKETKRPASADTIIPAPSNTSWFRPRREGPYSTSELLHFLPHQAEGGGIGDGRQVITGWRGNSEEKKIKTFRVRCLNR